MQIFSVVAYTSIRWVEYSMESWNGIMGISGYLEGGKMAPKSKFK